MLRRFSVLALSVALSSPLCPSLFENVAEARPIRRPGVHALLIDLAQIEAFNGERDDQRTGQQIHHQVIAVRINLLRVLSEQERLHQGGRAAMEGLYNMALLNNRAMETDPEAAWRVAGSIEHMRQRLEQLMMRHGPYQRLPVPREYRVPSGYQPPIYRGPVWDPFQGGQMPVYPGQNVPPVYQQTPPVNQQTPPVYQQTPPTHPHTPPGYQHPQVIPVDPGQFGQILSRMQRLSFSDEKQNYVRDLITGGHHFTCEQIVQLMRTTAFSDDQVKIGAVLYPRAVDPQNFMQLTSSLTFESDRQKLRRLIGK